VLTVQEIRRIHWPIRLLAAAILLFFMWTISSNQRPDHSAVNFPYRLNGGNLEIEVNIGKSGVPRLVLAEVPPGQPAWEPWQHVDEAMEALRIDDSNLYIGGAAFVIRKEIKLPGEQPLWSDLMKSKSARREGSKTDLPEGGPGAFLHSDNPSLGFYGVRGYEVDAQLLQLAKTGRLVVAAVDPDGTVTRVTGPAEFSATTDPTT
jgi:hypothetical protein